MTAHAGRSTSRPEKGTNRAAAGTNRAPDPCAGRSMRPPPEPPSASSTRRDVSPVVTSSATLSLSQPSPGTVISGTRIDVPSPSPPSTRRTTVPSG